MTAPARTARLLVMGDTGVGKSEFLAHVCGTPGATPGSETYGPKAWVYLDRGPGGRPDCIEFIELCGDTTYHGETRKPMFKGAQGIVLVYDLTDDASAYSLRQWYRSYEAYVAEAADAHRLGGVGGLQAAPRAGSDLRARGGARGGHHGGDAAGVPVLIVGTRQEARRRAPQHPQSWWWRASRAVINVQRRLASILRVILFLPMPNALFSDCEKDAVLAEFRARPNTAFMEWSSTHPSADRLHEARTFLRNVLEGASAAACV